MPKNKYIDIEDKEVLKSINKALGKGRVLYSITVAEAESVTELDMSERKIDDLWDLRYLTNLRKLNLAKTELKNLRFLTNLYSLEELNLKNNKIDSEELFSLWHLKKLKKLNLCNNNITSIGELNGLVELRELYLTGNTMYSISGIEYLVNLESLTIDRFANGKDYLKNLKNFKSLEVGYTHEGDIDAIADLTNLEELNLRCAGLSDISPLKSLENLKKLDIAYNPSMQDITVLKSLKNLESLDLTGNKIEDLLSSINGLTKLKVLKLEGTGIKDVSSLKNLSKLEEVNLSFNKIENFCTLLDWTNLKNLELKGSGIEDISFVASMINLEKLDLEYNRIKDISPLKYLRKDLNYCVKNQDVHLSNFDNIEIKNRSGKSIKLEVVNVNQHYNVMHGEFKLAEFGTYKSLFNGEVFITMK